MEKYSDEMVKRWNGEIDTLLVYVRVDADRRLSYTDHLWGCPGRVVLRGTDRLQRPVVPAAHPTACHRSGHRRPREDLGSAEQLLSQSPISQLYPSCLRIRSCPSSRPAIRGMAERSLVRKPHLQLVGRIGWHYGQAMVERVQHWTVRNITSGGTPSPAATQ